MPHYRMARHTLGSALALALLTLLAPVAVVHANGKPIQITLTYLANVSNAGPQNAAGTAELVLAEGEARVRTVGLPRLNTPERYAAWLMNTQTGESLNLGFFNTPFQGAGGGLEQVLPDAIPDRGWNLLVITMEADGNATTPSDQRGIAGYFPTAGAEPTPNALPRTGGYGAPAPAASAAAPAPATGRSDWLLPGGLAALIAVVAAAAGYLAGRKRSVAR